MGRAGTWLRTILSQNATAPRIAGGVALGLALSLVPVPFAGMTVALALAPILRLNLPATYAGTAVVNPVTGPFFYFAEYWVGARLRGHAPPSWTELSALDAAGWWALFRTALPDFLTGAAVVAAGAAPGAFVLAYVLVVAGRRLLGIAPATNAPGPRDDAKAAPRAGEGRPS